MKQAEQEERRNDMKRTAKKNRSKAPRKKAIKDLEVRRDKSGDVRGGPTAVELQAFGVRASIAASTSSKVK